MKDYLEIGQAPCDEECAQVGDPNYQEKALQEAERYIELIRAKLGPEPDGARLRIKSFPHDYGNYYEVVVAYDDEYPESVEYAFNVEANLPTNWEGDLPKYADAYREDMARKALEAKTQFSKKMLEYRQKLQMMEGQAEEFHSDVTRTIETMTTHLSDDVAAYSERDFPYMFLSEDHLRDLKELNALVDELQMYQSSYELYSQESED